MQYPAAHALSVFMLTFSFLVLVALAWLNRRRDRGPA
jgi:ABC-type sulfate transport system permease component